MCPHGAGCYRKNPTHRVECAHPGDADWVDAVDDDGDEDYDDEEEDKGACLSL